MNKVIGFHSNELVLSGGSIVIPDYAYYNQEILNNRSYIFCKENKIASAIYDQFLSEYNVIFYEDNDDLQNKLDKNKVEYLYLLSDGKQEKIISNVKNLIHGVFHCEPYGDKFALVSKWLADQYNYPNVVPHIVHLPDIWSNKRLELNIPNDAIVFGRYGSYSTFDLEITQTAIKKVLELRSDLWFLFMNTHKFIEHERVLFLDGTIDLNYKTKFINTCDAMIHGRYRGETFGLAIAEFSIKNKPVYTWWSSPERAHIDILKEKGVYYNSEQELIELFLSFEKNYKCKDWNAYQQFNPELIMEQFEKIFLK